MRLTRDKTLQPFGAQDTGTTLQPTDASGQGSVALPAFCVMVICVLTCLIFPYEFVISLGKSLEQYFTGLKPLHAFNWKISYCGQSVTQEAVG